MNCQSCGAAVEATQKFCAECGIPLQVACPTCGHVNPPGNKFCPECGTGLTVAAAGPTASAQAVVSAEPARPVPERRFVSVLFADLVGFTTFSEGRDPEDVRRMLTRYFERSRGIVERYSGTVDKFIGDAVMAVWGAVSAHEDDAERAVRAALELVDGVADLGAELGIPELRLRAGVLSGETAVGPEGNDRGLVVGDLVNTASRLQSIAEPGTVFIGAPTFELVGHVVECSPAGTHDLKGKSEAVEVYRADRVIAGHGGRRRADTVEPPFVGRDDELRLLKDQLHAVGRDRRARMVSIVGEAGIGKSRLAWELFKYVDGLPEDTYWHQGRSPSYGDGLALWSVAEMVRRRAGIAETDEAQKSRMKLRTALAEYVPDEDERRWVEPWLGGLLGIDEMPPGDRSEMFAALRTLFQHVADRDQTVLVFEDLHWADEGTLEFITELLDRSQHHPLLVVTLARPDLLDRQPGWGSGRHAAASIRLSPLADDSMVELVTGMAPGVPDDAVAELVRRAAGIPLYAVEFVRMLLASGDVVREGERFRVTGSLEGLAVPDSLQAVVGARIDRLPSKQRGLVQDAAVLGQAFTISGLVALRGETADELTTAVMELVDKELFELDDDPRSPERGQYHFVQEVVKEVAYGRISREDRYLAHVKVAGYFEELDEPELALIVASHLQSAQATAPDAEKEQLLERALEALGAAADRAADLHAYPQVLAMVEQALEMAPDDDARAPFWERAAAAAGALAETDRAAEFARKALAYTESLGDRDGRLRTGRLLGSILGGNFRADEAVEVLEPIAEDIGDDPSDEGVRFLAETGRAYMLVGRSHEAIAACDRALPTAERRGMVPTVIDAIVTKGTALGNEARTQESVLLLRGAALLAEEHDIPWLQLRSLNNLAVVLQTIDPGAARQAQRRIMPLSQRVGDLFWEFQSANVMSMAMTQEGRYDDAIELVDRYDHDGVPEFFRQVWVMRREWIEVMRGDPDAPERAREAMSWWDDQQDPQLRTLIDLGKATLEAILGDFDHGYELAEAIYQTTESFKPDCLWTLAHSAAWARDRDRLLTTLELLNESMPAGRYGTAIGALARGALAAVDGNLDEAVAHFEIALEEGERISEGAELTMARLTFAALVGFDHPAAAEAGAAAAAWIDATGTTLFRTTYAEGLPSAAKAETA